MLALPGLLTLYLGFSGGGFFAGQPALLAVVLAALLILRITLVERPFAGLTLGLAVGGAALGLLAVWILLSWLWSDAPGRAIIEFDRALMLWLALVLFGSLPRSYREVGWAVRGLWLAIVAVCVAGLVTRVLPEVWPIAPNLENDRLSYPLTYWNALGVLAAVGLVFALHLTSSEREPAAVRGASAASVPLLAATLAFTYSRGAIAACAVGVIAYLVLARPWGAIGGLVSVAPPAAVAVAAAYGADRLAQQDPTTPAAVAQGEEVALVLAACALTAGIVRLLLARVESTVLPLHVPRRVRGAAPAVVVLLVLALAGTAAAAGGAGYVERQYERFVRGNSLSQTSDARSRVTDVGNNGRLDHWNVALDAFEPARWTGTGAGTYTLEWLRERERQFKVEDAHSLYLETLGELGVVGLALLLTALVAILAGFAGALRRERAHVYAALLAAGLVWTLHAGIDWDWEMPATSLWLFALGGWCLARPPGLAGPAPPGRLTRVVLGLGCLVLALTPAAMAVSQGGLTESVERLRRGDCLGAIDSALASTRALSVRAEPYVVLALCDARLDRHALAEAAARRAVQLDPRNWEAYYTLAIARANAGRDPRAAVRRTLALNPLDPLAREAKRRFRTNDPKKWRRRARTARLPLL